MILLALAARAASVQWCLDVDGGDYPSADLVYDAIDAWRAWEEAIPCLEVDDEYLGDCDLVGGADIRIRMDAARGDEWGVADLDVVDGGVEIVLSETVPWLGRAEASAPGCTGGYTPYAVLSHLIGHALGMGHTPDRGDPVCPDGGSMMAPVLPECAPPAIGACDAQEALRVLGPVWVDGTPAAPVRGATPLQECVGPEVRTSRGLAPAFAWVASDGATGAEAELCHTWADDGGVDVTLGWTYPPECGGWSYEVDPWVTITACAPPRPEVDAPGLFTAVGGRSEVRVDNHADLSTWACVDGAEWTLRDAGGGVVDRAKVWAPTFRSLPAGNYVLSGAVDGPGGRVTEDQDVRVGACAGCAAAGPGGVGWLALGVGMLLLRRRKC